MAQATPPPRSVFKGAVHSTGLYFIPLIGQRLISIILLPMITRVLTPADYGMLNLLEQTGFVLTLILCGTVAMALGYFYFERTDEDERREVAGTVMCGSLLLGCLAGLICWPFAGLLASAVFKSGAARLYLLFVFLSMPMEFFVSALMAWLRVEDRARIFVAGTLLRTAVQTTGLVVLVGIFKMRVMGYLYSNLAALAVSVVVLGPYCFRYVRPSFRYRLFLRMMRFAAPIGLAGIATFVVNFGDQFILLHFGTLDNVGIYSLAYRIGMLVMVAYAAFQTYWSAQAYQILRREDAEPVFARLTSYVVTGLAVCSVVLVVASRPGLRVLVAPKFEGAVALIPVIVAAYFCRGIADFFRYRLLAAGRPGYDAFCNWLAAGICLIAYFILIPRFGTRGAAIATLVSCFAILVLMMGWAYRLRPYVLEGRLTKLGGVVAAVLILYFTVPVTALPAQIVWGALLMGSVPLALWVLRFPTDGEVDTMRSVFRTTLDRWQR